MQTYARVRPVQNPLRGHIKADSATWVKTQVFKPICASRICYYESQIIFLDMFRPVCASVPRRENVRGKDLATI